MIMWQQQRTHQSQWIKTTAIISSYHISITDQPQLSVYHGQSEIQADRVHLKICYHDYRGRNREWNEQHPRICPKVSKFTSVHSLLGKESNMINSSSCGKK